MQNWRKAEKKTPEKQKNLEMEEGYDKIYHYAEPLR